MRHIPYLILIFILNSCGSRELKSGVTREEAFPANFTDIRERILIPRCANCHGIVESHKLLLEKYVVPGNAKASELWEVVEGGSMPPYSGKLLDEEIEAIAAWIDAGAKND